MVHFLVPHYQLWKNTKSQIYRDTCIFEKNTLRISCTEFYFLSDRRNYKMVGQDLFFCESYMLRLRKKSLLLLLKSPVRNIITHEAVILNMLVPNITTQTPTSLFENQFVQNTYKKKKDKIKIKDKIWIELKMKIFGKNI